MNSYFIKPVHYNLEFTLDFDEFKFFGKEIIEFHVEKPTKIIELDCVDISVQTCVLQSKDYTVTDFHTTPKNLTIQFDKPLKQGAYNLKLEFLGELKDTLAGFYRSRIESPGSEAYIATTQFEPADARRAFPCIDHPSYKATFDVTLIVDADKTAISNTICVEEELLKNGKKKFVFERTPRMSTYLLYLGAGNFEMYEDKYKQIIIRGITTSGKSVHTKFAVECTKKSLEYFEEYFGVPYPLKKLDIIAVADFAAGAMENWGAITFRENLMLYYEESSSITTKQRIAEVVAHEVAHQWFGNLVTMKWWDDLWLNESFATFMAYKVIDHYWPEWDIWTEYVQMTVFGGMKLDSLRSSHPIHVEINDIDETGELFDEIAYDKGGSILRMIEGYLGENIFREGLRHYIKTYEYANTEGKNLWNSLGQVSGKPVESIMESQTSQTGFPSLKVSRDVNEILIQQSRFLRSGEDTPKSTWQIPLKVCRGTDIEEVLIKTPSARLKQKDSDTLLYINQNYNSFFISDYSDEILHMLGKNIQKLSDIEKLGLIHDHVYLVYSGKKKISEFLHFFEKFFKTDTSIPVTLYILAILEKMYLLSNNKPIGELLKQYAQMGISMTGYMPESHEHPYKTMLRSSSLGALSIFDDPEVEKFTKKMFAKYVKDNKSVHQDLKKVIVPLAVWYDDNAYDVVIDLYKKSSVQEEKVNYLTALGSSKNKALLAKTFTFILSEEVRFNQLVYALFSTATNPYAKDMTLEWTFNHWNDLITKSGGTLNNIFRRILQNVIPVCAVQRVKEVNQFIQTHNSKELSKTYEQVIEELHINIKFLRNF